MGHQAFRHRWRLTAREDEGINYAPGELTFYSSSELDHTNLSPATKKFLIEGGLPKETVHGCIDFNAKIASSTIESLKDQILLEGDHFNHYYIIGNVENGWICINSDAKDQVVVVDTDYPDLVESGKNASSRHYQGEFFMNSSVVQLAECLLTYQEFWHEHKEMNEALQEELQEKMRAIDPACMEENTFWWYGDSNDSI